VAPCAPHQPHPARAADAQQQKEPSLAQPDVDPLEIDGRTFDGIRFGLTTLDGAVVLKAQRVEHWREHSDLPTAAGQRAVSRMLLTGDVEVQLGIFRFNAARAAVWIQKLDEPGEPYQIFIFFDRVSNPTADAAISVTADRLPVRAVINTEGGIQLSADLVINTKPQDRLLVEGERALAAMLRGIVGGPEWEARARAAVGPHAGSDTQTQPGIDRPFGAPIEDTPNQRILAERMLSRLPPIDRAEPIFADTGTFSFHPGAIELVSGEDDDALLITDGVKINYWDRVSQRNLWISAERAVVFLDPGSLGSMRGDPDAPSFGSESIRGFFLEGNVTASDGQYTIRGPRIYYDVRNNRAIILEAVFWTYDEQLRMPLYVRAETMRQQSATEFRAEKATFANTAFFEPHLSIGASSMTISRVERPNRPTRNMIDARNVTLRVGPIPFFYWPIFRGDLESVPIREFGITNDVGGGTAVKTAWDPLSMFGLDAPKGVTSRVLIDYYSKRNLALGGSLNWVRDQLAGDIFGYWLPSDDGQDVTPTGTRLPQNGRSRGLLLAENRWKLNEDWSLALEASWVSDETLLESLFLPWARSRRELTTRATLARTDERSLTTIDLKTALMDFTPNEYLLQSQGYTVARAPDIGYYRIGDDLLPETLAGLLSYTGNISYSRMQMEFTQSTPAEFGFLNPIQSILAFGLVPNQSFANGLTAQGLTEDWINRLDTRNELSTRFDAGPVRVRPYGVGRLTAYDNDFTAYSPQNNDQVRLWGALGVDFDTTLTRVDNGIESDTFDLHRMRHIIEPSVNLWYADTNMDNGTVPIYDTDVEQITQGGALRFGLDQTWETKRGGPGRWRNVDVFKLNAELVFMDGDDTGLGGPIPRYVQYRPELSNPGEFFGLEGLWQVSDALAVSGSSIYDFDTNQAARYNAGLLVQHSPSFQTLAEIRYINPQDSTYINFGASYKLTPKYVFSGAVNYSTEAGDVQNLVGEIEREFPNAVLGFTFNYNRLQDQTSIGFIFRPLGVQGSQAFRLQGLGNNANRGGSRVGN